MKTNTIIATISAISALTLTANAAVISLTADAAGSTAPGWGGSLEGTLTDTFAYDEFNPTSATPDIHFNGSDGFHPDGNSNPVVLKYTLADGAYTVGAGQSIVLDVWGRDSSKDRDDNFDVTLYSGGTVIETISGEGIDDSSYHRVEFTVSEGQSFDRVEITGHHKFFAVMETRLAAVPEPSSAALLGLGGLALILRRRK